MHIDPVTETEHEYILQLPRRSELLFQLYSVWENLENSEKIKNIHLHYLTRQIEVDIILPLEFGCDKSNTLAEQLYERADNIPFVGKINIYYAP